jgi:DNA-binding transcriptional LysR family regulator
MDYCDWEILKVLYSQKNLTKAARLLNIAQPALTKKEENTKYLINLKF